MRAFLRKILCWIYPQLKWLKSPEYDFTLLRSWQHNVRKEEYVTIHTRHILDDVEIGKYSYVGDNSTISHCEIGRFCSIGPNLLCGWGTHPINGISTSPLFYSTKAQNGVSLTKENKVDEYRKVIIGHDVYIGADVTILDGVTIGNGAVIGAGAVVSKDIPPYAIAVGCPIQIKNYRFSEKQIAAMQRIQWWNWEEERLQDIERMFFDIDAFIAKYDK